MRESLIAERSSELKFKKFKIRPNSVCHSFNKWENICKVGGRTKEEEKA